MGFSKSTMEDATEATETLKASGPSSASEAVCPKHAVTLWGDDPENPQNWPAGRKVHLAFMLSTTAFVA